MQAIDITQRKQEEKVIFRNALHIYFLFIFIFSQLHGTVF